MILKEYKLSISTGETIEIVEIEFDPSMDPEILSLCCRMSSEVLEEAKYGDDFHFRKCLNGSPERNLIRCKNVVCTESGHCVMENKNCAPGQFLKSKSLLPTCFNSHDNFTFMCIHAWREGKYVIVPS